VTPGPRPMAEPHPLVRQLRFTRAEFLRGVAGVADDDARVRLEPMNCLAWNVGHLAWQEQRYFVTWAQGRTPFPDVAQTFAYGAPASTPHIGEILAAWRSISAAADPWLDGLTSATLLEHPVRDGKALRPTFGDLLLRTIYHYWYHTGENQAIRQLLGHRDLPEFVGSIDAEAPYRPEGP
jgi:hypothetical protein